MKLHLLLAGMGTLDPVLIAPGHLVDVIRVITKGDKKSKSIGQKQPASLDAGFPKNVRNVKVVGN